MNYEKRYKEMLAKARAFYKKWDEDKKPIKL